MKTRFHDRVDAAHQLAKRLKGRPWREPLVLAIPRGGVVIGAALADDLGAELDVVLSRKLRAPYQPELAIGAIAENGQVYLNHAADQAPGMSKEYVARERRHQHDEIARRSQLFRAVRPAAPIAGRSVIITDDGIATGSTMMAALQTVRAQGPHDLIVAVPVACPDRLEALRRICDEVVCLLSPEDFMAVGQYYEDFGSVEDEEALELLRRWAPNLDKR